MEYVIEFDNVSKQFRRGEKATMLRDAIPRVIKRIVKGSAEEKNIFWALRDVSFKIEKGSVVGIIGSNGAGKTTLLKLLSGVMDPTRGNISINGRLACLIAVGAGFHPEFTGRENIYLCGSVMGMKKHEITRQFDSIVQFAGYGLPQFHNFIDTPIKRYSAGMYVRLGFAIAAHINPDILLVDEVLAVGDYVFQQKCFDYMQKLKEDASTVILISHNMNHILTYCSRVILLDGARVRADGPPADVVKIYQSQ